MSNSPLVDFTRISPNKTSPRGHKIDTITIHCVVGQLTPESLGAGFATESRRASSNYGVGTDGRIGMYVEEKDRSWCSSNYKNDDRAITIEVASDRTYPYAVNDKAYKALINLLVDICKRNGIKQLLWKNDKSLIGQVDKQNMTLHRWFAATECPGDYLVGKHSQIAAEVNARLNGSTVPEEPKNPETTKPESTTKPATDEKTETSDYTKIVGTAVATAEQMTTYIKKKNPNIAQSVIDMIPFYISEGKTEGIRGDIAFAQSCIETGNFTFPQNTCAVNISQNNFCMLGVTGTFEKGNSFKTPQLGIRAQIQHLKAYASKDPLVGKCIDPRFSYVTRGCAPYVEWLGMKENPEGKGWASAKNYGSKILRVLGDVLKTKGEATTTKPAEDKPSEPETVEPTTKVPFTVSVNISDLAIRKGPGTNYDETGSCTGKGTFTIVQVKNGAGSESGWGRLKSGAGWISLDFGKTGTSTKDETTTKPAESTKVDKLPYKVKVDITNLNVRKGPGSNFNKTGLFTGKGIFTITEVRQGEGSDSGWGKLKSGAGWISLDYVMKV